ncbi:potassium channel family protein [Kitasatospora sp. NBC_00240]|uniref:potassium channel family protein n=1 Tax=Kitasatospora sp. NBC_00240 TaxID=2903567 RepID=UPI00225BC2B9|nr:potassium channel family protein [Kitasatospora sp. NBC_00240]MCX5212096.1 potassium channel family protein [Kitasatospora sp. NBC_00240]
METWTPKLIRGVASVVGGFAALMIGYFTLPLEFFGPERPALSWLVFGTALTVLTVLLLRKTLQVLTQVGGRPGVGLAFLILLSMVVFSAGYFVLAQDNQFNDLRTRLDALYFTVITMSTVGYGDITPTGDEARVVVILQIFYNFVFLAAAAGSLSNRVRGQIAARVREPHPEPGPGPPPGPGPEPDP